MESAWAFLGAGDNILFVSALALMILIGLVEAIGLGASSIDLDGGADTDGHWLSWLGGGRLPLLMLLVLYFACFGLIGLSFQQVMLALTGDTLTALLAGPAVAAIALPVTGLLARPLARIMPRDETTAIDIDMLVGLRATIVTGRAAQGYPARARVKDHFGQAHYVMAEPDNPGQTFGEGEDIILVRRDKDIFRAISEGRSLLPQLDS